jgi:FAD/FMN-containing dehydrogenase
MEFVAKSPAVSGAPKPDILARLEAIVGASHVIACASGMEEFLREPRGRFHGSALCAVQPASTGEVAAILRLCNELIIPVVPQGGNTGLVGGQVPVGEGREIMPPIP